MTSAELLTQFVSGGLLGMAGQTIRTFVGLTKANSEQAEISLSRIFGSLAVGFSAGGIGIFNITSWSSSYDLKPQDFMLLLSIGYAGTDFLEGFFRALVARASLTTTFNQEELLNKVVNNTQKLDDLPEKVVQANLTSMSSLMAEKLSNSPNMLGFAALPMTLENVIISFGPHVNKSAISAFSLDFLKELLSRSGNTKATITSSARTPEEQARVMFDNIELKGVASQKQLYSSAGDQVIEVYVASKQTGKTRLEIIADMTQKIKEIGPSKVSRHCADFTQLVVVDIAPSSIVHKEAFIAVLQETKQSIAGFHFILPPKDPAFHIEIPNVLQELEIA